MYIYILLGVSALIQFAAAFFALRLIRITRGRTAWVLIALAFFLMALRRCLALIQFLNGDLAPPKDFSEELVALATSILVMFGVFGISPLFREIKNSEEALKKTKEELEDKIREQKQTETALRISEEKMRLVIEYAPIAIRISREGKIIYVNPATINMYGYENASQLIGLPVEALFVPEDREWIKQRQQDRLAGKPLSASYEAKGQRKDGKYFDLAIWPTTIDYLGQPANLSFVIDISETKALREQLLQMQKLEAIGTLAGGIAHDFNNILMAIISYAEMACVEIPPENKAQSDLKEVLRAGYRGRELVKHIMAFSRQQPQEIRPVLLRPLVEETIRLLRATLPMTIDIHFQANNSSSLIMADPTHIHQVVMNLGTNAYHAMREQGGNLEVKLDEVAIEPDLFSEAPVLPPGKYVRLTMGDDGPGIDPAILERVFDPFFTTKPVGEGTGLGLSVVHGIITSLGGTINVNNYPGQGVVFEIYFPQLERTADLEAGKTTFLLPGNKENILYVDDELILAQVGKRILERLNYRVTVRCSSVEALEAFKAHPDKYDLVITDQTMPNMTGIELSRKILSYRSDIPIILLTGYSDDFIFKKAKMIGIREYLTKPIQALELGQAIRRILDQPADQPPPTQIRPSEDLPIQ